MIYLVTKTYLSKKIAEWTEIITYRLTAQARANMDQLRSEMASLNPEISVYTSVTYAQLVQLCNQSKLVSGTWYRMIDYVTKVANDPEARSAEHPFDLLMLATSENTLSEEVRFMLTSRNAGSYFKDCMLQAWKGWYSLTNDTSRFHWASPTGTGVIYRLIDEWGYDYPYDFKNIQFKRYRVFDDDGLHADLDGLYIGYNSNMQGLSFDSSDYVWCYTLSFGDRTGTPEDASLLGFNGDNIGNGYGIKGYYGNSSLKPATCSVTIDDEVNSVFCLNNVVCFMNNDLYRAGDTHLDGECINMTLSTGNMTIGSDNMNIIMGARCYDITIGTGCCELTFSQYCNNMSFSQGCGWMSFSQYCNNMSFSQYCYDMSFSQGCRFMSFSQYCNNMSFSQGCGSMSFSQYCYDMSFSQDCYRMSFSQYCNNMSFSQDCYGMSFSQGCGSMSFSQGCRFMSFSQYCNNMSFSQDCYGMSFSQDCYRMSFSQGCSNINVDAGVHDLQLPAGASNIHIFSGVRGSQSQPLGVATNADYTQFVAMGSNNNIRIFNPADVA